ncbi:hypothetical protein FB451DRAFT_1554332 [Mycena latifolia]|nr:hypothetical protein FB451DRAFT_1554332 [Mycena latifolia]
MQDLDAPSDMLERAALLGTNFSLAPDEDAVKIFPELSDSLKNSQTTAEDDLNGLDVLEADIRVIPPRLDPKYHVRGQSLKTRQLLQQGKVPQPRSHKSKSEDRKNSYYASKMAQSRKLDSAASVADRADGMRGFAGPREGGPAPGKALIEVDLRDGGAVSVYANGIKTVHRANSSNPGINKACCKAAQIVRKAVATHGPTQARGRFKALVFSLHRGSCLPRMSKDVVQQPGTYKMLKECLEPVRKLVDTVLKAEFPQIYRRYKDAVDTIAANVEGTEPAFSPFTSFASTGRQKGVAAGQPIFFPSALYTHYNTQLISMGMRGSIVGWTGVSIFQYVDLGCRAVSDLGEEV